jgi:hypothetical protein
MKLCLSGNGSNGKAATLHLIWITETPIQARYAWKQQGEQA